MRSLTATAGSTLPAASGDKGLAASLDRVCALLGIAGARLTMIAADGVRPIASVGPVPDDLAILDERTVSAAQTCVIADAAATGCHVVRFYAGLLLAASTDRPPLLLTLFDLEPRSQAMVSHLVALAYDAVASITIEHQRRLISAQAQAIAEHTARDEQRRRLFDRASATARIGVWQCELADESLQWTDSVYDLFELPRGSVVTREQILALYTETARKQLEVVRSRAIANCSDFSLDAEIVTARGTRRWMRLTGTVESQNGVAVRIFGMKQDITDEKLMADRTRYLAEFDVMTGLANRSQFQTRLAEPNGTGDLPPIGALLLVDLDNFKQINDTHGHALGDECLKEVANRLRACCSGAELVARIGGDEFAVLLGSDRTPAQVDDQASAIVVAMRQPFAWAGETLRLSVSVGAALHESGGTPDLLFRQADTALYAAKAGGRDTSHTFRPEAERRSA